MGSVILFLILTVLILAGGWYAYSAAFYAPKHRRTAADAPLEGEQYEAVAEHIGRISSIMQRIPFQEVRITARDGTVLYGRYYHIKDGAPIELLFHGYRSHPYRDCSGGHALARKMGFNTLVVDQRAHGSSGGHTITFGVRERLDCMDWIHALNLRFGAATPVILSGLSMGAATVLMASGLDLPDNVTCIMADSPYSSPGGIIRKVCRDDRLPVWLCMPFVHLAALLYGCFRLNASTAKAAVRNASVPILLIHGEDDRFVPWEMSLEIAANAASRTEVVTFPGAGHGLSYLTDPIRYEKTVCSFLRSIPEIEPAIDPEYLRNLRENYPD